MNLSTLAPFDMQPKMFQIIQNQFSNQAHTNNLQRQRWDEMKIRRDVSEIGGGAMNNFRYFSDDNNITPLTASPFLCFAAEDDDLRSPVRPLKASYL